MTEEPEKSMDEVIAEDGRYPPEAFAFMHDGLTKAVKEIYGEEEAGFKQRHVTGAQLCNALRELAIERWGMLAKTVLSSWSVCGTIDFGNMVYLLVSNKFMRKTDEDSIEDFRDVYDFEEAFRMTNEFGLKE